jgi:bifunctional non-homologous end joining protein LigD
MAKSSETVQVGGHRLVVSNLDKVMYPETGTTKADVLAYYAEIAEFLLPYAAGRPVTRKRWVDGVDGPTFFQKDIEDSAPDWVPTRVIHHKDHDNWYPVLDGKNGVATLAWFAQVAALELHVPQWRFRPDGKAANPDRMVFDLDPGEGAGLPECVEVAKLVRGILDDVGLPTVPVTSGSKGIHLYAVLDGSQSAAESSEFAHELARSLEADHPDLVISTMRRADRSGKVLLDWSQNNGSKTTIAPYSLRGRARPMVAMPRTWREITSGRLRQVEMGEVLGILRRRGDAGEPMRPADADQEGDRLTEYRNLRDADKTPEPVPPAPKPRRGPLRPKQAPPIFVIQRHAARRLHFDFRLEHDGVLVSWAVPKGVPDPGERNRLAVHVEDHPLEYAKFRGDIPRGEYGAGHVDIWDHGTYELEKWREDEVIVTLHGSPEGGLGGGPVKVALIRTDRAEGRNWLLHRMAPPPAEASFDELVRGPDAPVAPTAPRKRRTTVQATATAGGAAPAEIRPMLAQLGSLRHPPRGRDLAIEMKWDGVRVLAHVQGGETRLLSRNGIDVTATYPEFANLAEVLGGHAGVLDGEVIALDAKGYPSFSLLQRRMRLQRPADVRRAAERIPVRYVVFDLVALDGEDLTAKPYRRRRKLLEATVRDRSPVHVSPIFDGTLDEGLDRAAELHLEGVVVKEREAPYSPGRRTHAWTKVKLHRTQEVVIAGWRPGKGSREGRIGSLLLGIPDGGELQYVGRVGTGFDEAELAELGRLTARIERRRNPLTGVPAADARDARWVAPRLVGEVEYAELTGDGRLRHPTWRGLRPDKDPEDIVPEREETEGP